MQQTEKRYQTIRQAAATMGLPEFRVRQWAKQGRIPGFASGNRFYIDRVRFQALLDEGQLNGEPS